MAEYSLAERSRSGIYQIRNLVNGKCYIGSAVMFRRRWAGHLSLLKKGRHHSRHLQNSWNKRGEDQFAFEIVEFCDVVELIEREQHWIDTRKPEYNGYPTAGSPLGFVHGPEFREAVSRRFKGKTLPPDRVEQMRGASSERWGKPEVRERMIEGIKKSYTSELRQKRSEDSKSLWGCKEYKAAMRKKIADSHDEERRALTSEQSKKRWASEEYRERMRIINKNKKPPSEDTKEKIRQTLKGRKLSVETKRKKSKFTDEQIREMRKIRESGATHESIAKTYGVSLTTIARIFQGLRYQWVD